MVADLSSPSPAPAKPKRVPLKSKNVTSRYMSYTDTNSSSNSVSTNTKRFPSRVFPVRSPSPATNRRDHPQTGEITTNMKLLTKTSTRSLSVSFQGESFTLPVSKAGKPANNGLRNSIAPERKKPPAKVSKNFMTMSVDFTDEKVKLSGSETVPPFESDNSDHTDSYPDSNSSESTADHVRVGGPRAILVPARFWQETINLLRRVQQPVPVAPSPLVKNNKPVSGCKVVMNDGAKLQPRRSALCVTSPMNTGSILSICADSKRGKVGEKKVVDAHVLRVLHNKHMQWRFANAKVDAAMVAQRAAAQKTLYNAWVTISKLWNSVISKRLQLQQLKHNLKLHSLLKKQMLHLDNWELTDTDHSISLTGAIGALESSSLCLPVLCGAKADIQNLKDAICSAVDVMQAMAASVYSLITEVENVNSMASELATAMKAEFSLLDQCKDMLSTLTLLEKQDCSLRAHTLQLIPATTMPQQPKMMPF